MTPAGADGICVSLNPVWDRHARVLVLGSMPGAASLRQQQYYAHPHNAFWPIMAALLGFSADAEYAARLEALRRNGVGLWDVLASCERRGSLDSDIREESPNPLVELLAGFDTPRAIVLNGRKAQQSFERFAGAAVRARWPALAILAMPSTSPAHASLRRLDKQAVWSRMLNHLQPPPKEYAAMAKKKVSASKAKKSRAPVRKSAAKAGKKAAPARKAAKRSKPAAVKKRTTKAAKPAARKPAAKKAVKKAVKKPAKTARKAVKKAAKKTAKKTVRKVARPASRATKKAVGKTPRQAAKKTAKKTAGKVVKKVAKTAARKAVAKPVRKPAASTVAKSAPGKSTIAPPRKKPTAAAPAPTPRKAPPADAGAPPSAVASTTPQQAPASPAPAGDEQVAEKPALFKQPLVKPEPWHFGGRPPEPHEDPHGVKAQPDAERLAGKSRKVH